VGGLRDVSCLTGTGHRDTGHRLQISRNRAWSLRKICLQHQRDWGCGVDGDWCLQKKKGPVCYRSWYGIVGCLVLRGICERLLGLLNRTQATMCAGARRPEDIREYGAAEESELSKRGNLR
jgi:hypothetical protein